MCERLVKGFDSHADATGGVYCGKVFVIVQVLQEFFSLKWTLTLLN